MASGYHAFSAGEKPPATTLNDYLSKQAMMKFTSATDRDTQLSAVLREGMAAWLDDVNALTVYNGTAWAVIPFGRLGGVAIGGSNQTGITTPTALTGYTITFTAIASRRYVLHYTFGTLQVTTTGEQIFNWTLGGVAQSIIDRANPVTAATVRMVSGFVELGVLGAGSKTVAIQGETNAGSLTIPNSTQVNGRMLITDVGL